MKIALVIIAGIIILFLYIYFTPKGGLKDYDHSIYTGPETVKDVIMWIVVKLGIVFIFFFIASFMVRAVLAALTVMSNYTL